MKIEELLESVNEAGSRTAAQQASMQATATGNPADNTIPFPAQPGTTQTPTSASTTQPAAGTTGDATLDQPLAPKKPGTTFAQKLGSFAKGVGAVAGAPAGIGRAIKKGYEVGASAIGGPGAAPTSAPSAATNAPQVDQADELAQLRSQLQVMQQKLTRAGINENQKKGN